MTLLLQNLAIKYNILLFYLPSYLICLSKHLDIKVFQLFKYYYIDIINKTLRLEIEKFGKVEFLDIFWLFCN